MPETPLCKPLGNDWFLIDWAHVWASKGLSPAQVPGVVIASDQRLVAPRDQFGHPVPTYPHRVHLTHLRALGYSRPPYNMRVEWPKMLRTHQAEGVIYINGRRGTLLADEMRVGKTATIMYSHNPNDGQMLVVGPLAARAVWHEWAARRFGWCRVESCSICNRIYDADPDRQLSLNDGTSSFVALESRDVTREFDLSARIIFCHFAIVPAWKVLFDKIKIGTLVVDEVHLPQGGMQSRKSITSEALRWFNTVAKKAVFASGSPLWNKPKGLWPILDMLTPGAFGGFWDYARRYCDAVPTAYGWQAKGSSNEAELQERLRDVMLRRTWKQIAPNLPPINRSIEVVGIPVSVRDRTEEMAARIRSAGNAQQTVVGDLARLRKMYAEHKVTAATTRAAEIIASGSSVIIWTWHREIALQISRVTGFPLITGDSSPGEREKIIEDVRFTAAVRPTGLIATMGALATAVNLNFAEQAIFVELDWNPDSIAQAEMRPYDGTRPIAITYLVADCDVEQKLADALLSKLEIKDRLGVAAGVGSVAEVLRATLGIENARTLSALADAVLAEAGE